MVESHVYGLANEGTFVTFRTFRAVALVSTSIKEIHVHVSPIDYLSG